MASVMFGAVVNWRRVPVSPSVTLILYSLITPLTELGSGGLQFRKMCVEFSANPEKLRG